MSQEILKSSVLLKGKCEHTSRKKEKKKSENCITIFLLSLINKYAFMRHMKKKQTLYLLFKNEEIQMFLYQ